MVLLFSFTTAKALTIFTVPQGGTGVGTITGVIKGNGTSPFSAATAGTDYLASVNHDSTLTGSGTSASALGIDLSHANTWTGQQTFNTSPPIIGTGGTTGVTFLDGSKQLTTDNTNLVWDNTLKELTIGGTNNWTGQPNTTLNVTSNVNAYSQINNQNKSAGNCASTDYINEADNDGVALIGHYTDIGINSSTYSCANYPASAANDGYFTVSGGGMLLSTDTANKTIRVLTGGLTNANERLRINDTQLLGYEQLSWQTGLGAITQILGPSDQALKINSGNATGTGAGAAITVTTGTGGTNSANGGTGGAAGNFSLLGAAGGTETGASGTRTGGAGSSFTFTPGVGGVSVQTQFNGADGNFNISMPARVGSSGGNITFTLGQANSATGGAFTLQGTTATASNGTQNIGSLVSLSSGQGQGNLSNAGAVAGAAGAGGAFTISIGAGGAAGGGATSTGGNGGAFSITGGAGGTSAGATLGTGGNGTSLTFTSGAGGNATAGSGTRNGGNAGSITFTIGAVGTGATANGASGLFSIGLSGSAAGVSVNPTTQQMGGTIGAGGSLGLFAEAPGSATGATIVLGGSTRGDATKNAILFRSSATEYMRVDGDLAGHVLGNVGIGTTTPTALLQIKAGTATASTAPLKFTSGTLLGTPEAGAFEFLTDKYYATITTGAARKEFTLNDAALTSGTIPVATTNGRLTDSAFTSSNLLPKTDTVTALNKTADIASANFTTTGAGLYRVSYYLVDSTADLTAGAERLNITYTDAGAAQTAQSATVALTILGTYTQGSFVVQLASGNIAYSTTHTGIFGTATYNLYMTVERLN